MMQEARVTYIDTSSVAQAQISTQAMAPGGRHPRNALVVLLRDDSGTAGAIADICDFLDLHLLCLDNGQELDETLATMRPMAVISSIDAAGQDGCHTLMQVAQRDASLPVMMITGSDPRHCGAVDAVEEVFALTHLSKRARLPTPGDLVDFLAMAGRAGQCLDLLPI